MKIHEPIRVFHEPDNGGGSGGGDAPLVAPSSDGIISADSLAHSLEDDASPPLKSEAPPVEKKPDDEKPPENEKRVEPVPEKKDGIKNLRDAHEKTKGELQALTKERDTIAAERAALSEKISAFQAEKAALEKERDEMRQEGEGYYKDLLVHQPEVSKELKALDAALNKDLAEPFEMIPNLSKSYSALLQSYNSLPWGKPELAEQHAEFRAQLKDDFPDDWQDVEKSVKRGASYQKEHSALREKVRTDAAEFQHSKRMEGYGQYEKRFAENAKGFFEVDAEVERQDPYNPVAFVKKIADGDPKVAEYLNKATEFAKNVYLGPKPLSQKDFAGLDAEQIGERIGKATQAHEQNRDNAVKMIARGLAYEALFRPMAQELQKLRELVKQSKSAEPPEPSEASTKVDGGSVPSARDVAKSLEGM